MYPKPLRKNDNQSPWQINCHYIIEIQNNCQYIQIDILKVGISQGAFLDTQNII